MILDTSYSQPILQAHCQNPTSLCTNQSFVKELAKPTHGRRESTGIQHCIKAIAGEVVNSKSVHLIKFRCGSQVIALKSATAHTRKPLAGIVADTPKRI